MSSDTSASEPLNMMQFYPKGDPVRTLAKSPMILWRLGLGPVIGKFVMVITTRGRKSGKPHSVMTEYHEMDGLKYVPCAFGERSDWYKNIQADPYVTIQTSSGTEKALASRVIEDGELLELYHLIHARNAPMLIWYLNSLGIKDEPDEVLANKNKIVFIRFDPVKEEGLPGLEVDLAWIYPAILFAILVLRILYNIIFPKQDKQ